MTSKVYTVRLRKYNQQHDQRGEFTGPGTSHQPTGNPPGRPQTAAPKPQQGLSAGKTLASAGITTAAGVGGGIAGEIAGGAIGSVFGPPGAIAGGIGGQMAGQILGGLIGDALGTKIGNAILNIKEKADGHGVGMGATIGQEAASVGAYGLSRLLPGGSAVRGLFDMVPDISEVGHGGLAAARIAQGGVEAAGGLAGGLAQRATMGSGGKKIGRGAQAGLKAGKMAAARALQKGRLPPDFLTNPPKAYTSGKDAGSFVSMYRAALPNLFGPANWSEIKGTNFGRYISQRVQQIAEKMDDAAAGQGIELQPADPASVELANQSMQMKQQDAMQQQQQHELQMAQAQSGQPKGGSPFGKRRLFKTFSVPMRAPNDAASTAYSFGGTTSAKFLERMQAAENNSRKLALTRALAQPQVENLAQAPGEDERMYANRMQRVMAASIKLSDRLRPQLFNGGASEAGLGGLFPDQQRNIYQVRASKVTKKKPDWTITSEIAKQFNTPRNLKQGLVYGWASIIEKDGVPVTDHEGDRIEVDHLTKAAHNFISKSRNGGVLHDEHGHHIGHIVESVVFSKELQQALGIDLGKVGWLIGYQITDPRVKMLVQSDLLKSFSIGGKGRRVPVTQ